MISASQIKNYLIKIPSPGPTQWYARMFALPNKIPQRQIRNQDFSKDPVFNFCLNEKIIVKDGTNYCFSENFDSEGIENKLSKCKDFKIRKSDLKTSPDNNFVSRENLYLRILQARYGEIEFDEPESLNLRGINIPKEEFDKKSYQLSESGYVSIFYPRLKLGDLVDFKLVKQNGKTTLENLLYIPNEICPIYIVVNHQEALYCWAEAAERGNISKKGNTLLHLDDHQDSFNDFKTNGIDLPTLQELGLVFQGKKINYPDLELDPAFFITTAIKYGLVNDFWYIRGQEYPETEEWRRYDAWVNNRLAMIDGFDTPPIPPQLYTEAPPFHLRAVEGNEKVTEIKVNLPKNKIILDIDVDVDHGNEPFYALKFIEKLKSSKITPGVVTIALSPPENYDYCDIYNLNYSNKAIEITNVIKKTFWKQQ